MAEGLSKVQIGAVSEKIMDWGNLVFAGFVIGQIVPGTAPFRLTLFLLGIIGMMGAYVAAYFLMKRG